MNSNWNIKLIASDMDDTLLNSRNEISSGNAAAIHRALEAGLQVLIATGRMYVSAKPYVDKLGLDIPLISYNGALVKGNRSGEVFYEHPLRWETSREVLAYCRKKGYYIQAYIDDALWVKELTPFSAAYTKISGIPATPVGDRLYDLPRAPYKLLVMTREGEFKDAWEDIQTTFSGSVVVTSSKDNFLELMEPGVNKWQAVTAVAERYGIGADEIMCIGDSNNDLSMIQNAALGVAVANAKPAVKAAAKWGTGDHDADGVAEAIDKLLHVTV